MRKITRYHVDVFGVDTKIGTFEYTVHDCFFDEWRLGGYSTYAEALSALMNTLKELHERKYGVLKALQKEVNELEETIKYYLEVEDASSETDRQADNQV